MVGSQEYVKNYTMYPKRIHLDTVGSTNRHLSEIIKSKTPTQEIVLIADYQENGMGQGDHHWHSSKGENLLMSVLLFPAFLSASSQFHLSRVASLALCDTLKGLDLTGTQVTDAGVEELRQALSVLWISR